VFQKRNGCYSGHMDCGIQGFNTDAIDTQFHGFFFGLFSGFPPRDCLFLRVFSAFFPQIGFEFLSSNFHTIASLFCLAGVLTESVHTFWGVPRCPILGRSFVIRET